MESMLKVAKEFPDVKFEHATGYKTAPNMSVYSSKFYQGRYIQGVIAGHMSKKGSIDISHPFQFQKLFVVLTHFG